jgi:capsular exopolysaccharide synthesis family protein
MSTAYEALNNTADDSQPITTTRVGRDHDSSVAGAQPPGFAGTAQGPIGKMARKGYDICLRLNEDEIVPSDVEESFLALASTIRPSVAQTDKRVILVTSSVRGEGKSFIALNLSASLARMSMPTLLIDADLRVPASYEVVFPPNQHGLLTYLEGRADFSDCLFSTSVPGLSIVPSGGGSRAPLQHFASARMKDFVANIQASARDHCILIDSPPGLSVPEVRLFRDFVDASLIVVAANRTPRAVVGKTLELLKDIPTLGLVMNRYKPPHSAESYYSHQSPTCDDDLSTDGLHS